MEVSALGLGCMRMSFGDTSTDRQEMISRLHAAVERKEATAALPLDALCPDCGQPMETHSDH